MVTRLLQLNADPNEKDEVSIAIISWAGGSVVQNEEQKVGT